TKEVLASKNYQNLIYYKVEPQYRGLTKQRNYGIDKVCPESDIVAFLDDDTILAKDYFEKLIQTYNTYPNALAVGGYINNEVKWQKVSEDYKPSINEFAFDGYK